MSLRNRSSAWGACLALLLVVPSGAVSGQAPGLAPFFDALDSELEAHDVFAIDGASVVGVLGSGLGWTVTEEDVDASLGSKYRTGRLFLFLACEADTPCIVAAGGSHAELTRASMEEGSGRVELLFLLRKTDEGEQGVVLRRLPVTLVPLNGEWRVIGGAGRNRGMNPK